MIYKGIGVSGGENKGKLVKWTNSDLETTKEIIVLLPDLDVDMTEFSEICGIVSFAGGITSHGAVVAREMGIPCVVLTNQEKIEDVLGKMVLVDGWEGIIKVIN
ncbi:MAG: hypothetical protein KKG99_07415 [Bacteroidetes bacterium]|nr:hypothetical protein [Bacteroidota bacterium]